jgi:hypothetical protein
MCSSDTMMVALPVDTRVWHPSALASPMVLVSTIDVAAAVSVAPRVGSQWSPSRATIAVGCYVKRDVSH